MIHIDNFTTVADMRATVKTTNSNQIKLKKNNKVCLKSHSGNKSLIFGLLKIQI